MSEPNTPGERPTGEFGAVESKVRSVGSGAAQLVAKATSAAKSAGEAVTEQAKDALRKLDDNHEVIADHADTVAKATRVAAGVATVGAAIAAPTGLVAVGVAVGLVSAPLIVSAAPVLVAVAGGAFTLSAAASLYSKAKRKRAKSNEASQETPSA